jgi:hypothetical protein
MISLAKQFAEDNYAVAHACITDPQLSLLYRYARRRAALGTMKLDDTSPGALSAPGDIFMDGLLVDLLPLAESITQLKLFPTFSYFRVYHRGDVLERHTDRPACEIGLTLCLGYVAIQPWPIMIECANRPVSVELAAGDAVLYRGIECAHWRDAFDGEHLAQVILNYVDQTGPYADWKYDKRPALAFRRPTGTADSQ